MEVSGKWERQEVQEIQNINSIGIKSNASQLESLVLV